MRSTITLEPDVAQLVEDAIHTQRKTFKQVINDALRIGLSPLTHDAAHAPYRVEPYPGELRPEYRLLNANQLAAELEEAEISHKVSRP